MIPVTRGGSQLQKIRPTRLSVSPSRRGRHSPTDGAIQPHFSVDFRQLSPSQTFLGVALAKLRSAKN
jgi:hypothetical protein